MRNPFVTSDFLAIHIQEIAGHIGGFVQGYAIIAFPCEAQLHAFGFIRNAESDLGGDRANLFLFQMR